MRRRTVVLLGASVLVLALVLAAGAWGYSARVWLMDDFRAGYSVGAGIGADHLRERTRFRLCEQAAEDRYGADAGESDSARVFWSGCARGAYGGDNDWWYAAQYLDD